ncbi:MAG: phosphodiesterase [Coprobacillaceae bacterium]
MKVMFISDIHGSYTWLEKAMNIYKKEDFEKLIILGDILYHGPRNPLPDGYDCQKVAKLLNGYENEIIAVRGNCDAEVDQMVLTFDVMQNNKEITLDGHHFFLTHGHHINEEAMPKLNKGDILAYGHFHKPIAKKENGIYIINPSSISLPKEGINSYGVYENNMFSIKDFNGEIVAKIELKN